MSNKVFWTISEQTKLARAIANWQLQTGTKMITAQLINELQGDILDRHRRRHVKGPSQVPWIADMVEAQRQQILALNGHPLKHLKSNGQEEPKPLAKPPTDLEILLKQLVAEVSGIHKELAYMNKHNGGGQIEPDEPEKPKEPVKKVLMIGPMDKQLKILQDEFKGLLDLTATQEAGRVADMAKNKDKILLWTNKISHKHGEAARRVVNRDQCWNVTGGMTSLRAALEEIAIGIEE